MADRIRVALVDGQPLYRQGLANAIVGSKLTVVAESGTAHAAHRAVFEGKPDILLLDIGVPGDGMGAAAAILRVRPNIKIVILTASDDEEDVTKALRMGAHGYILKDVSGPDLVSALEAIHRGEPYITPALASRLLMQSNRSPPSVRKIEELDLTPRDRQILGCLAKGLTNQEIARSLGVNIRTIKHCLTLVFRKMRVRNRVEAVIAAQKMRLRLDGQTPS